MVEISVLLLPTVITPGVGWAGYSLVSILEIFKSVRMGWPRVSVSVLAPNFLGFENVGNRQGWWGLSCQHSVNF